MDIHAPRTYVDFPLIILNDFCTDIKIYFLSKIKNKSINSLTGNAFEDSIYFPSNIQIRHLFPNGLMSTEIFPKDFKLDFELDLNHLQILYLTDFKRIPNFQQHSLTVGCLEYVLLCC